MSRRIGFLGNNTWADLPAICTGWLLAGRPDRQRPIQDLHAAFEKYLGGGFARSFGEGRIAMYALLKAWGVGPGDEVILPGFTCIAVPLPIVALGATPVYVDIDERDFNTSLQAIEQACTKNTKVIIAQHGFGVPVDMDALMSFAKQSDIKVLEDATHGLGSEYRGRRLGTIGHAAFFSGEQTKIVSSGQGGVAYTRDAVHAKALEKVYHSMAVPPSAEIRQQMMNLLENVVFNRPSSGRVSELIRYYLWRLNLSREPTFREGETQGVLSPQSLVRLSASRAGVLLSQMKHIEENTSHRKRIVKIYDKEFEKRGWKLAVRDRVSDVVMVRYPFRVAKRAELMRRLKLEGIDLGCWFEAPIHPARVKPICVGYEAGCCPRSEAVCTDIVNLPTHLGITEQDAQRMVARLEYHKDRLEA